MSDLGYLERLLDGAAVEWVPLGEVTLPTSNIKWREVDDSRRYIDLTSVDVTTKKITETKEVTSDDAPSRAQKIVMKDDLIFATTRPTQLRYCLIGDEYSGEIASTGYCVLRANKSTALPKWIMHWLGTPEFKDFVEANQSGAAYPAISDGKVKEFLIPIPCPEDPQKSLTIQAEIVRILDAFTALTAELTAELTARKTQYNHYRNQLLSFEGGEVEWKTLGEVFHMRAGQHISATDIEKEASETHAFPCFGGNGVRGYVQDKSHVGDFLLIGRQGALCGNVQRVKGAFYATEHAVVVRATEAMNVDWAYHYLTILNLNQYASQGSLPGLAVGNLLNLKILVPPLAEQTRIATILDKFDTLTTSLSEGLPREIVLRRKQYEHYRNMLLGFPAGDKA